MGSESHKLLREPLSLLSVRRGSELPFGKTPSQQASESGRAVSGLVPGPGRQPWRRADCCSASCPLPLATDRAAAGRLRRPSLQGSKVTSGPLTHRRIGDRGPGSGCEEEAVRETGLAAPTPPRAAAGARCLTQGCGNGFAAVFWGALAPCVVTGVAV